MRENPHLTELASATSTGLLAEEMVFVISDLLREKTRPKGDSLQVLTEGRELLKSAMGSQQDEAAPILTQLTEPEGTLDTLRAVLAQEPNVDVKSYVVRLDVALQNVIEGEGDLVVHEAELTEVRDLFSTVGHLTLSRANRLTRSPQEKLGWSASATTLNS
jgi:hypothetical protein